MIDLRPPTLLVLLGGLVASGCGGGDPGAPPAPTRSRVDAVAATPEQGPKLDAFCEVLAADGGGLTLSWPELDGEAPAAADGWTWVSLWATWCGPCVEEVPLMRSWEEKLRGAGLPVAVEHVSVDASAEDLATYRGKHPDAPTGPRVADQAAVAPWLTTLGLDEGAAIPIHLFVDPTQRVRCIRVGAVSASDYATVKRIVGGN
ncbi:MAG: hypothetical protein QGH45_10390 [Myxococcota bacterium]|nr:hypothetical protein [Myxococcota bacterium]